MKCQRAVICDAEDMPAEQKALVGMEIWVEFGPPSPIIMMTYYTGEIEVLDGYRTPYRFHRRTLSTPAAWIELFPCGPEDLRDIAHGLCWDTYFHTKEEVRSAD